MKLMTYEYKNHPLPILVSARVRLNSDQKKALKDAYYKRRNENSTRTNENGLVVDTNYTTPNLDKALGMSPLVFSDVVNSRDTLQLSLVLKLQKVLEVEVITQKEVLAACKSYCEYVFTKED